MEPPRARLLHALHWSLCRAKRMKEIMYESKELKKKSISEKTESQLMVNSW